MPGKKAQRRELRRQAALQREAAQVDQLEVRRLAILCEAKKATATPARHRLALAPLLAVCALSLARDGA